MDDQAPRPRIDRTMDRFVAARRRLGVYARELVKNPVRLLIAGVCIVLVAVAIPLLVGGGTRLDSAWAEWRHERSVGRDWIRATGTLEAVRESDGLRLRLSYFDRTGEEHRAEVKVDTTGASWINARMPIRYDPQHTSQVDLVGIDEINPLGSALVAGAAIGTGLAALILAFGIWKRRRVLAESNHPITVLRVSLALSGFVLAIGLAAWAVGTVKLRGWSGVADRLGSQLSVVFGDMLGVTLPLVTFAIGCLLTAWLARHRHHEDHEGMLSSVHRLIDRAAGYVPSPEDLQADAPDGIDAAPAAGDSTAPGPADAAPEVAPTEPGTGTPAETPAEAPAETPGPIRTGR